MVQHEFVEREFICSLGYRPVDDGRITGVVHHAGCWKNACADSHLVFRADAEWATFFSQVAVDDGVAVGDELGDVEKDGSAELQKCALATRRGEEISVVFQIDHNSCGYLQE